MSIGKSSMGLLSEPRNRIKLIDYVSPDTEISGYEFALMFGSRHAQAELVDAALELFHSGYYETLIIAGGKTRNRATSEASEIAERLISAGLSSTRIILEEDSSNTAENVQYARTLMKSSSVRELLLIGKIYAKRRYVMTIKKNWPEIERVSCFAVNYFCVSRAQWWESPMLRMRILQEVRKIERYLEMGYLSEVEVIKREFRLWSPSQPLMSNE
jgi:uncharacterized SAM-binding protein YcdF (DUF218 family)